MNKNLKVAKSIEINARPTEVWDALTNPNKIKVYLYGTETITDWKVGSSIIFQGEYDGHKYKDKGMVLQNLENKTMQYSYWSGFSGLEDKPENYSLITYHIEQIGNTEVEFTWTQQGFASEENMQHSASGLTGMLEQIKNLVESN